MTLKTIVVLYTESHYDDVDLARAALERNTRNIALHVPTNRDDNVPAQLNQAMSDVISAEGGDEPTRVVVFLSACAIVAKGWLAPLQAALSDRASVAGTLLGATDVMTQACRAPFASDRSGEVDQVRLDAFAAALLPAYPPVQKIDPVCVAFRLATWHRTGKLDRRFDGSLSIADWAMRAVERTARPQCIARNSFVWTPLPRTLSPAKDSQRFEAKWVRSGRHSSLLQRVQPRPLALQPEPYPVTKEQQLRYATLLENLTDRGLVLAPMSDLVVSLDPRTLPPCGDDAFFERADTVEREVLKTLELDREANPPDLSVCMIVKNEEAVLERCLKSVRSIARQIVVLDTGSSDRTKEIALASGAEVHDFDPGSDFDFSAARNASLALARCAWVLVMDADECLLPSTAETVRQLVEDSPAAAYNIDMRRYVHAAATERIIGNDWLHPEAASYPGYWVVQKTSLWPRQAGIRYAGEVHEHVMGSVLEAGIPWLNVGLEVHEIQYRRQGKARKYSDIGRRRAKSWPSPQHYLSMGLEMIELGDIDEAHSCFDRALPLVRDPAHHVVFSNDLAVVTTRQARVRGMTAEIHRLKGIAHWRNAAPVARTEECFRAALLEDPDDALVLRSLALFLASLDRFTEACELFQRCLPSALHRQDAKQLCEHAAACLRAERLDEALRLLETSWAMNSECTREYGVLDAAYVMLGVRSARAGDLAGALASFAQAVRVNPGSEDAQRRLLATERAIASREAQERRQ
jgi:tetratricopeptide (TPR) repeat protein